METHPAGRRPARYHALVPAAGCGARMGTRGTPKQYLALLGRPLLWHSLAALCSESRIERVHVVLAGDDAWWRDTDYAEFGERVQVLRCGGETRAQSVANGLDAMAAELEGELDWVLVHDAARPCLGGDAIEALLAACDAEAVGGILAMPVADTLKVGAGDPARVVRTVSREGLWQAQTPQMFRHGLLVKALRAAPSVTDEASAVEALGFAPQLVPGDPTNLKVTYPRDLALAEMILSARGGGRS